MSASRRWIKVVFQQPAESPRVRRKQRSTLLGSAAQLASFISERSVFDVMPAASRSRQFKGENGGGDGGGEGGGDGGGEGGGEGGGGDGGGEGGGGEGGGNGGGNGGGMKGGAISQWQMTLLAFAAPSRPPSTHTCVA